MAQPLTQLEANRLRQSLGTKLANEARSRGVAADPIRKQYIFTIFLSRIFQDPHAPWVLLGGNALLIRTGGGRFTQDVDLAREAPWTSPDDALSELRRNVGSRPPLLAVARRVKAAIAAVADGNLAPTPAGPELLSGPGRRVAAAELRA